MTTKLTEHIRSLVGDRDPRTVKVTKPANRAGAIREGYTDFIAETEWGGEVFVVMAKPEEGNG